MKYIKKIGEFGLMGSIGVATLLVLAGCNSNSENTQNASQAKKGAFVIIEEQNDGSYKILEEYPSDTTRILLKAKDGTERMLSQEEIDKLVKEEDVKINNGTSELTNPDGRGLSLGEAILASAAGAIVGSWIGGKLFNNQNYQTQQRTSYTTPQAYEQSKNSFNNTKSATSSSVTSGKSGFFGGGSSSGSSSAIGG